MIAIVCRRATVAARVNVLVRVVGRDRRVMVNVSRAVVNVIVNRLSVSIAVRVNAIVRAVGRERRVMANVCRAAVIAIVNRPIASIAVRVNAVVRAVGSALPSSPMAEETRPVPARVESLPVKQAKCVMLFNGGVILDDGRKITIGETLDFAGKTETLAFACAVCGVIGFESGKRERF